MDFVVLAKVVPALESLRFDPVRRTVIRDGAELYLNPFDQRALRVALELRRPGETVRVVSLGPPSSAAALRDARALGADRVRLLTDACFAGSDVLATARALAQGIGPLGSALVLAGAWSTDSETGQVGPEVAALLGIPVVSEARAIVRSPDGSSFSIEADTPTGWVRVRAAPPLVITVGEKIAKPLRPTPESLSALREPSVELVGARELEIDPAWVGLRGSPTEVVAVEAAAPSRTPRVFAQGAPAVRVQEAVEALRPLLRRSAEAPAALPPAPASLLADREVGVLVTDSSGELDADATGVLSEVRRALADRWPSAIWVGAPPSEGATYRLELAGALGGYVLDPAGVPFDSSSAAIAVGGVLDTRRALGAVVFSGSPFGREVAGLLAARRALGLVGDAVTVSSGTDGSLLWTKPSFGGRTLATIRTRTRPGLATVRPGTFAPSTAAGPPGGFRWRSIRVPWPAPRVVREAEGRELEAGVSIERSDVVVAVGMGVGGPDGITRLGPTLATWGAALTATRRVVDAGWVPRQLQVGLTGRALAPRLAILLGVRGATNHMIGWKRAGTTLAVNQDPEAPVFRDVDVGIVGSVEEIVPLLEQPVASALRR
jgi:electron transfer flavoprotein alpha subunit